MGWAFGRGRHPRTGRERDIGYGVTATCDQIGPKCTERIDRGLAYYCGDAETVEGGGEWGCGGYFCSSHLYMHTCEGEGRRDRSVGGWFCSSCIKAITAAHLKECRPCRQAAAA